MAQATFSYRMDKDIKNKFDMVCSGMGINVPTAINMLAMRMINDNKIPFEVVNTKLATKQRLYPIVTVEEGLRAFENLRKEALQKKPEGMTLEEINEKISHIRNEVNKERTSKLYA